MNRVWVAAGLVTVVLGCGGDGKPDWNVGGNKNNDAGTREGVDAAVNGDAGMEDNSRGPIIEFLSPEASSDPVKDTVITEHEVTVRCKVTPRSKTTQAKVDASSVKITLENSKAGVAAIKGAVDPKGSDVYEAKFDLSAFDNGKVIFHCAATDMAKPVESSTRTLAALLDLGPTIEIFDPVNMMPYALKTPVPIKFQVNAAALGDADDPEAKVASVELTVLGVPITATASAPGEYQTSVDFGDTTLFETTPTSSDITISATNSRSPTAAVRTVRRSILIDGAPPAISFNKPVSKQLVHDNFDVVLTITDAAGVDPTKVTASIEGVSKAVISGSQWKVDGNTYSAQFASRDFSDQGVQFTIVVSATDRVGNEATASQLIYVDNLPPLVSLDPPTIREYKVVNDVHYCSADFDPVGSDAVSDTEKVSTLQSLYRVLAEDRATRASGSNYSYYAGIRPETVLVYVQKDPNAPILIDADGKDHICDHINIKPAVGEAPSSIKLAPLTGRGGSWFRKTVPQGYFTDSTTHNGYFINPDTKAIEQCSALPSGSDTEPTELCPATAMTRVVQGRGDDHPPAVFALSPTNNNMGPCEGLTWEVLNIALDDQTEKGWRCVAATATDTQDNVGVSAPIRVCFSKTGADCDGPPPNCTPNCDVVPAQRFPANDFWLLR